MLSTNKKALVLGGSIGLLIMAVMIILKFGSMQSPNILSELNRKAKAGESESQYSLGLLYFEGNNGVQKNNSEALSWFRRAAEQNHVKALTQLGDIYRGKYPEFSVDHVEALNYYKKAAYRGDDKAALWAGLMLDSGKTVPKDELEAIKWYRRAAELGNQIAQNNLRAQYSSGVLSRKWADEEFIEWCRSLAKKDVVNIQLLLGDILCGYGKRIGVTDEQWGKDQIEGANWYYKVAKTGDREGQWAYGRCYLAGGMPLDSDVSEAESSTRTIFREGSLYTISVIFDSKEAMKWMLKSANQKYAPAQRIVAILYRDGKGVKQSKAEAIKWFRLAASQGDEVSIDELKILEKFKGH